MARCLILGTILLFEIAVTAAGQAAESTSQVLIQIVDADSGSSIENAAVTLYYSTDSSVRPKFRTTDGRGMANFGGLKPAEFKVEACRPDYIASGPIRWNDLREVDKGAARVLTLRRGTSRGSCTYREQIQRRRTRSMARRTP